MVYDKDIMGEFVTLRSITEDDAEFSYNIRKDPRFVSIMGQPASSVEAQREYIIRQRSKPGDYYFVVYNRNNEKIGLIGVYDIRGDNCETGRELNIGEPYETMEAQVLLYDFCVGVLGLKNNSAIVYKNNPKQINMIKKGIECEITEIMHNGIPSYLLKCTFEGQLPRIEKLKKTIHRIAQMERRG